MPGVMAVAWEANREDKEAEVPESGLEERDEEEDVGVEFVVRVVKRRPVDRPITEDTGE